MAVDGHLRARRPAAVDQRGVVAGVAQNGRVGAAERLQDRDVGRVAARRHRGGGGAEEAGERLLQVGDGPVAAGEVAGAGGTDPQLQGGPRGRLAHRRVDGEAEVVIGAEDHDGPAVDRAAGLASPLAPAQASEQPRPFVGEQGLLRPGQGRRTP